MKISIVTAAYNGAPYLARTLDSVLTQTCTDWEHVIVDDGSADDTFGVAQSYAERDGRFRPFRKTNGGVADTRNYGYERISPDSEYVIFLDHDDCWKPHALERLLGALTDNHHAVAAHGLARMTDLAGGPMGAPGGTIFSYDRRKVVRAGAAHKIVTCTRDEPTTYAVMICDCAIPTPGIVLIRRAAFDSIRYASSAGDIYFDQVVASGDDWDVWLRLTLRGDFAFVDDVMLDWRQHDTNGSKNEYVTFTAESKVRKKMASWPELSDEQRGMAEWRYRRIYASIERRNASACWAWALQSVRRRDWRSAPKFAGAWRKRYWRYVSARLLWNSKHDRPIPSRLVDTRQILEQ